MEDTRSERYFATTIGLPNYGLDPTRDCTHVRNEELRFRFGEKVTNKGYCYEKAKTLRVAERVRELYPPCFQTTLMPKGSPIPESFARAVVSEVCYHSQMNGALYAVGRNKNKAVEADEQPVVYMAHDTRKTYSATILEKLDRELEGAEKAFDASSGAHRTVFEQLQMSKAKQLPIRAHADADGIQAKLVSAKDLLTTTAADLENLQGLSTMIEKGGVPAIIAWHRNEIEEKMRVIAEVENSIRGMVEKPEEARAQDMAALEEEEKRLLEDKLDKFTSLDRLKVQSKRLVERFGLPATRTACRYMEDVDIRKKTSQGRNIQDCAFCETGFPLYDVVLAPCFCVYHPWCAAMQTSLDSNCAATKCKKIFPAGWLKSFGFFKDEGMI